MPTSPVSATVDLVGVPAIISAKENPKIAEMYSQATMAAIDGMPIVKLDGAKDLPVNDVLHQILWEWF